MRELILPSYVCPSGVWNLAMSRGKLIRATSPDTGSMLATMSVSVNVVRRFSAASIPVSRMLIRASGVSGVATGGTTPNRPVGLGVGAIGCDDQRRSR